MINEHQGGVECRSPLHSPLGYHSRQRPHDAGPGPRRSRRFAVLGHPARRPCAAPRARGFCGMLAHANPASPVCALARRSAARRRPRRPAWLPLALLRGRCRFRSALSRAPAVRGPPARAPGAAVRPRRVPLRGARRTCPGSGRRFSAPGGLIPAALGALRAPFPAPRGRAPGASTPSPARLISSARRGAAPPRRLTKRRFRSGRRLRRRPAYMRAADALASPHAPHSLSASA